MEKQNSGHIYHTSMAEMRFARNFSERARRTGSGKGTKEETEVETRGWEAIRTRGGDRKRGYKTRGRVGEEAGHACRRTPQNVLALMASYDGHRSRRRKTCRLCVPTSATRSWPSTMSRFKQDAAFARRDKIEEIIHEYVHGNVVNCF